MLKDLSLRIQKTEGAIAEAFRLLHVPPSPTAESVEKVVVILGSSRSGSSYLFHLLSESGAFWTPQGEESAFHRLAGLGFASSVNDSDALSSIPSKEQLETIRIALMNDLGREPVGVSDRYVAQSIARVIMQWPERDWNLPELLFLARTCLDGSDLAWGRFLSSLGLDAAHYDGFGGTPPDLKSRFLLEEPPFITQFPRRAPSGPLDAPLLLKTSANVYRPELLHELFPAAEFKYILLTRNPAASINGLMDGWVSPAFHSHHVGDFQKLQIAGYSELSTENSNWWKFDLPPDWATVASKPLGEVCSFQWASAYRHALNIPGKKVSLRFENLIQDETQSLDSIFKFAGTVPKAKPKGTSKVIMSSVAPGPARWRSRQEEIANLIGESQVQDVARALGYNLNSPQELV